jgi:NADH:ubiquinone oxidoreductase subunit 3 (subunit A)
VDANAIFLGIYVLVALVFPFIAIGTAYLLRPKRPHPEKYTTYESGMQPRGEAWVRFRAPYYVYALVFVLFDVEMLFLYPWAAVYRSLPLLALAEGVVFIGVLAAGLAYIWAKGDLRFF